jgi:hypothetical protein
MPVVPAHKAAKLFKLWIISWAAMEYKLLIKPCRALDRTPQIICVEMEAAGLMDSFGETQGAQLDSLSEKCQAL